MSARKPSNLSLTLGDFESLDNEHRLNIALYYRSIVKSRQITSVIVW